MAEPWKMAQVIFLLAAKLISAIGAKVGQNTPPAHSR